MNASKIYFPLLLLIPMLVVPNASHADLVLWDFTGTDTSPTNVVGDLSGSQMTVGAFTGGTGSATHSTGSDTIFVRADATGSTTGDGDSIADAIANDAFVSFSVTAGSSDLVLDTINWSSYATNTNFAGADFRVYAFQESVGFSLGNELGFTQAPTGIPGDTNVVSSGDVNLSGLVAAGSSEEFRFYFVDNASNAQRLNRLSEFTVNLTAVPEPSSALLFGFAGLACTFRRRKK